MFKKMMLFGLLLMMFAGSLFANGINSNEDQIKAYWDNMKKQGYLTPEDEEYNLIKKHFIEKGETKSDDAIKVSPIELPNSVKEYNWKRYYCQLHRSIPYRPRFIMPPTAIVYKDSAYELPRDFNYLIKDNDIKIDSTNVFEMIRIFIELNVLVDTEIENIKYKKAKSTTDEALNRNSSTYNLETFSYCSEYNVRIKWNFGFKNGKFTAVRYQLISGYENLFRKFVFPGSDSEGIDIFLNSYLYDRKSFFHIS